MLPLFEQYPGLRERVPHVALGDFPTPVVRMARIEKGLLNPSDEASLFIKRDDLSSTVYGGNKVRNLEFLLGRALHDGKKEVLTFGGAGSNQGVATAIYAEEVGLRGISMLIPQPNAEMVRRNLCMSHRAGAELHHYPGMPCVVAATLYELVRHRVRQGAFPQVIPPGGTSRIGMVGFVNAALELKQQVDAGVAPAPDVLYVALGTMGTAVGLLLGLTLAGLHTRVVAVRVTAPQYVSMRKARRLFGATNALLHKADPALPLVAFPESDFTLRHDHFGEEYGLYTEESVSAAQRVTETEGIALEPTYTGKAFAALLADAQAGALKDQAVLFWNTANSRDFTPDIAGIDYHLLPRRFHRYFEQEVQPLDQPA